MGDISKEWPTHASLPPPPHKKRIFSKSYCWFSKTRFWSCDIPYSSCVKVPLAWWKSNILPDPAGRTDTATTWQSTRPPSSTTSWAASTSSSTTAATAPVSTSVSTPSTQPVSASGTDSRWYLRKPQSVQGFESELNRMALKNFDQILRVKLARNLFDGGHL